ncbi:hypothetical protein H0H81_006628, partial [Sphagnurus paluster]
LKTLREIKQFLEIPHAVQELVSAEQTPTLTVALPAYEQLLAMFKLFKNNPLDANIIEAIDASIEKLETCLEKTRNTCVYAIALSNYSITFDYFMSSKNVTLVLNSTIKLEWLERNWSTEEVEKAKNWLYARVSEGNPDQCAV